MRGVGEQAKGLEKATSGAEMKRTVNRIERKILHKRLDFIIFAKVFGRKALAAGIKQLKISCLVVVLGVYPIAAIKAPGLQF